MIQCDITLTNEQDNIRINEAKFEEISCKILTYITSAPQIIEQSKLGSYDFNALSVSLDILICDDEKIKGLNKEYRGKDKATDVLSFALFADNPEIRIVIDNDIFLGEIIISADTAKCQADEAGKSVDEELYFLLSHGILHLFGFEHEDEESYEFMIKIQNEILNACT